MVCSIISSIQAAEMRVMYWRIHDALFTLDAEYELVFCDFFLFFRLYSVCVRVQNICLSLQIDSVWRRCWKYFFRWFTHSYCCLATIQSTTQFTRVVSPEQNTNQKNLCSSAAKTNVCRLCAGAFCRRFWLSPGIMWLLPSTVVHQCDRFSACKPVVWATKTGEREKVNNMRNEFNLCALTGVDH